jgi:hypothetical protein
MQFLARIAKFQHLAGHHNSAPAGHRCQVSTAAISALGLEL